MWDTFSPSGRGGCQRVISLHPLLLPLAIEPARGVSGDLLQDIGS
jgi:hypothetical protein